MAANDIGEDCPYDKTPSGDFDAEFSRLENNPGSGRAAGYEKVLHTILASSDVQFRIGNLIAYARSITAESIGVIESRSLLSGLVKRFLEDIPDDEAGKEVKIYAGHDIVQLLEPRASSFEQQDTELKLSLAETHESLGDFPNSAKLLETVQLESSQRSVSDDEKAQIWMRICRCYLEEREPVRALAYLNRTKNVIHNVTEKVTRLQFQLSQARISDAQRNFLDASASYLVFSNELVIDEEERLQALSAAITCAVLAPAGPQRARQLGKLYKDERAVETPEYGILEKIFLDRILSPEEVATFASGLQEHQLAKTADGSTVLDKAILEHNLVAISRIYANITFVNLGRLLGVDADRAEAYAATMIESGRLSGSMDQIDGVIYFNTKQGGGDAAMLDLRALDANILALNEEIEKVTTMVQREEPAWYEQYMRKAVK